jgi:hypothetical protein
MSECYRLGGPVTIPRIAARAKSPASSAQRRHGRTA